MGQPTVWPGGGPAGAPDGRSSATKRRVTTLVVAGLLTVALAVVGVAASVPYVQLVPNPPCDTLASCDGNVIISIPGRHTYPTSGHLYLTDVGIIGSPGNSISLRQALRGWRNPDIAVVPQEVIYPPSQTTQQTQQQTTQEMVESQRDAKAAALNALGLMPAVLKIADFSPDSPAKAAGIVSGDTITAINGHAVPDEATLTRLIRAHPVGGAVTVTYVHDGVTKTVRVRTIPSDRGPNAHAIIGVLVNPVPKGPLPFKIDIGLQNVGGPSAGLMFALGIYDKLTPGSLTGGGSVAGTGTIAADGTVGPIGGIQQKVVGAREAGATVFLSPSGNCADAVKARHQGVRIVKVDTFAQALSALSALRGGKGTVHDC